MNAQDLDGNNTALDLACCNPYIKTIVFEAFINEGSDISIRNRAGPALG